MNTKNTNSIKKENLAILGQTNIEMLQGQENIIFSKRHY